MNNEQNELVNYQGEKFKIYFEEINNGLAYILAIPEDFKDEAEILLETYNSGGKSRDSYEENILDSKKNNPIDRLIEVAKAPIVCPVIPDLNGEEPDYQQLSRECFIFPNAKLKRIDLKVIECIENAKNKIQELTGKRMGKKTFVHGYSASGVFAQRFAFIHPELVSRCCIGGAAGDIPVPIESIGYPIGISDYENLFGKKFDANAHRNIKFAYYVAENEAKEDGTYDINGNLVKFDRFGNKIDKNQISAPMHDMSYRLRTVPREVGRKQREVFGQDLDERWKNSIEFLRKNGYDISGVICKDTNHANIFNSNYNPYFSQLVQRLISFYNLGEPFKFDPISCSENINMSFQRYREAQAKSENDIERKQRIEEKDIQKEK